LLQAAVYGLNALGVKGKKYFKDRSIILATSYLLVGATVFTIKTHACERPDGSSFNLPSGHTANAFASAEFCGRI
jgi:membrane-associated phospholipid phosphatase